MKRLLILCFFALSFIYSQESASSLSGDANLYFISKLENGSIIKLPYRMFNISWGYQRDNQYDRFQLSSKLALEHQPYLDYDSFKIDLRELYATWLIDFGEIKIGNQIQSWGFVDENSPLDIVCPYDYNFLFEAGTKRKIATNALSMDMYYKNLKFGFTTTPFHSKWSNKYFRFNKLPSSEAEFPIELPASPNDYQFMEIDNTNEFGGYLQLSTDVLDVGLFYFSGYDRIFNVSGINIYEDTADQIVDVIDTVFSYRKTELLGLGGVLLLKDLSLRGDIGYFSTNDLNDNVSRPHPTITRVEGSFSDLKPVPYLSNPFEEQVDYYQMTLQLEYKFLSDINIMMQYFKHDTLSYNSIVPIDPIDLPLFSADGFDPYNYFYPGMGSPLALMTHNALLIGIEKSFNERISIQLRNLMDVQYKGYFIELVSDYKFSNKVTGNFAINYISGDEEHPNSKSNKGDDYEKALDYPLNQMENFSHFRAQLKYSF